MKVSLFFHFNDEDNQNKVAHTQEGEKKPKTKRHASELKAGFVKTQTDCSTAPLQLTPEPK
jgi:hypothetical protein